MASKRVSDPADWDETCPLGCEKEFHSKRSAVGPAKRHRIAGVPTCEMAKALQAAHARKRLGCAPSWQEWDEGAIGIDPPRAARPNEQRKREVA